MNRSPEASPQNGMPDSAGPSPHQKKRRNSSILYNLYTATPKKGNHNAGTAPPSPVFHTGIRHDDRQGLELVCLDALAHELRSPVTAIRGAADQLSVLARNLKAHPDLAALSAIISDSTRRLDNAISNLLDTRNIASGMLSLKQDWHDIVDIFADLKLTHLAPADRARVEFTTDPEFPLLYVDHRFFTRALANLIDNSLKNSAPDSRVTVSAAPKRTTAAIIITDEGTGFSPKQLRTPIIRTAKDRAASYAGTGIGMWISKEFIRAHGGTLRRSNRRDGYGAITTVSLPMLPDRLTNTNTTGIA